MKESRLDENEVIETDDEKVIRILHEKTGYDKDIIGCWYHIYCQKGCLVHRPGAYCSNEWLCRNMEQNYSK